MITAPPIQMANLGMADSLILMVMALVVFGPRRLPQIGRQIGKLMYEFRKASNDFKFQMEEELRSAEDADHRKKEEEERQRQLALAPPTPAAETATETVEPQNAESTYGRFGATESTPNESPYPYESEYPSVTAAGAPLDTEPAEAYPKIQPPTTGEQVPAEPPTNAAAEAFAAIEPDAVAGQEAAAGEDAALELPPAPVPAKKKTRRKKKEAAVEQTDAVTEQAAHNG